MAPTPPKAAAADGPFAAEPPPNTEVDGPEPKPPVAAAAAPAPNGPLAAGGAADPPDNDVGVAPNWKPLAAPVPGPAAADWPHAPPPKAGAAGVPDDTPVPEAPAPAPKKELAAGVAPGAAVPPNGKAPVFRALCEELRLILWCASSTLSRAFNCARSLCGLLNRSAARSCERASISLINVAFSFRAVLQVGIR